MVRQAARENVVKYSHIFRNVTLSQLLPVDMGEDDKPEMVPHPISLTVARRIAR